VTTTEDVAPVETALAVGEAPAVDAPAAEPELTSVVPTPEPWVMPPFVVADERGVAATVVRPSSWLRGAPACCSSAQASTLRTRKEISNGFYDRTDILVGWRSRRVSSRQ